jgi:hypothetical protein
MVRRSSAAEIGFFLGFYGGSGRDKNLCIGNRANYDSRVKAQASGQTHVTPPTKPLGSARPPAPTKPAQITLKRAYLVGSHPVFAW